MKKQAGVIIAAAVGALFATSGFAGSAPSDAKAAEVKCMGVNACKGQGACKTAANACKGQNSCKGTGVMMVATEKDCTDKGGKVEK